MPESLPDGPRQRQRGQVSARVQSPRWIVAPLPPRRRPSTMPAMPTALRRAAGAWLAVLALLAGPAVLRVAGPGVALAQESLVRPGLSEDDAVALVRQQTDGKVIRVDRAGDGGSLVYRIRVVTPDGRLREYRVDAATGRVR